MKVCFVVGSLAISGGTYVIFQHAAYLQSIGHDVTLAAVFPFTSETAAWHDRSHVLKCMTISDAANGEYDVVIATWWKTALELPRFRAATYGYFVQSIESRFYPATDGPLRRLVDATYALPVAYVTEARWIASHLASQHRQFAALVRNGIRKDIYRPEGESYSPRPVGTPRVLIEGPLGVSFKNTAFALRVARKAGLSDVWLMTGSPAQSVPLAKRVFSQVPIQRTAAVYRSCNLLLKLSTVEGMFGPPLEMFHCGGTAMVLDVTGHDEYIRDGSNGIVATNRSLAQIADQLRACVHDKDLLARLTAGARATAESWPGWDESSKAFSDWVSDVAAGPKQDIAVIGDMVREANRQYQSSEKARLSRRPWMAWQHRLKAAALRLPQPIVGAMRYAGVAAEVVAAVKAR